MDVPSVFNASDSVILRKRRQGIRSRSKLIDKSLSPLIPSLYCSVVVDLRWKSLDAMAVREQSRQHRERQRGLIRAHQPEPQS